MAENYQILGVFPNGADVKIEVNDEFFRPQMPGKYELPELIGSHLFNLGDLSWNELAEIYNKKFGEGTVSIGHWREICVGVRNMSVNGNNLEAELSPMDSYTVQAYRPGNFNNTMSYVGVLAFTRTSDRQIVLAQRGGDVAAGKMHSVAGLASWEEDVSDLESGTFLRTSFREAKEELGTLNEVSDYKVIGVAYVHEGKIRGHKVITLGKVDTTLQELNNAHSVAYAAYLAAKENDVPELEARKELHRPEPRYDVGRAVELVVDMSTVTWSKGMIKTALELFPHALPVDAWEAVSLRGVRMTSTAIKSLLDSNSYDLGGGETANLLPVLRPGLEILLKSGLFLEEVRL
tara:strand:+ start:3665 stop:4708 length:1044 start_codon:yes stop_codon:yes gene_type:complete